VALLKFQIALRLTLLISSRLQKKEAQMHVFKRGQSLTFTKDTKWKSVAPLGSLTPA
jgi:hypothetical protein